MDIKTAINIIPQLPARQAIMIRGPHGIGKSQIFAQSWDFRWSTADSAR